MDSISSIKGITPEFGLTSLGQSNIQSSQSSQPSQFSSMISGAINTVNDNISNAEYATKIYALDGSVPTHELMLHLEKAKFSLQVAVEIRNRMVEAYSELTRMQI